MNKLILCQCRWCGATQTIDVPKLKKGDKIICPQCRTVGICK